MERHVPRRRPSVRIAHIVELLHQPIAIRAGLALAEVARRLITTFRERVTVRPRATPQRTICRRSRPVTSPTCRPVIRLLAVVAGLVRRIAIGPRHRIAERAGSACPFPSACRCHSRSRRGYRRPSRRRRCWSRSPFPNRAPSS